MSKVEIVENPANRRRKRRKKTTRRRRYSPPKRRYRRRRNSGTLATCRNRRRRRKSTPRRRGLLGEVQSLVNLREAGFLAGGMISQRYLPTMLAQALKLPMTGATEYLVRGATALGGGLLLSKFVGRNQGKLFAMGAVVSLLVDAFDQYAAPAIGLSRYSSTGPVRGYLPDNRGFVAPMPNQRIARTGRPSASLMAATL